MCRYFAKNNRFPAIVRLVLLACLVAANAQCIAAVLYQFSDDAGNKHYLLGTMHSADPRVLKLLDQLERPLSASGQLVMEMVPDGLAIATGAASMMLPSGKELRQLAGASLYKRVLAAATERGLSDAVLNRLKPWAAAVTISLPPVEAEFLDQRIYQMALNNKLPVFGLETAAEQLAAFDSMSESMQIRMLREAVADYDQLDNQYESLVRAYLARDLVELKRLSREYESSDKTLGDWFEKNIIRDRNLLMADRLKKLLQRDTTFVAVGALHLAGETGLINSLKSAGYTVRPLY